MALGVDSTGLRLCGAGEWSAEKHAAKRRSPRRKLHLATDSGTGHIIASVLTDKDADYGCQVCPQLDRIGSAVASTAADGAFDRGDV